MSLAADLAADLAELRLPRVIRRASFRDNVARALAALPFAALVWCHAAPALAAASKEHAAKEKGTQTGLASYYSRRFEGKKTASGKTFRNDELVAAHASYPLGTMVRVTNLENDESVDVRITDRGASRRNRKKGIIIDVSQAAAKRLDMKKDGRVRVRVEVLEWGENYHKPLPKVKPPA